MRSFRVVYCYSKEREQKVCGGCDEVVGSEDSGIRSQEESTRWAFGPQGSA